MKVPKSVLVSAISVGLLAGSAVGAMAQDVVEPVPSAEATPVATFGKSVALEALADAPAITLPDELPDGARSGTIQTPSGPARWVQLTGTSAASANEASTEPLPAIQTFAPWDGGVAAKGVFGLWTTSDGVDWTAVPLPGDSGPSWRSVLKRVSGTYVLVGIDPLRVWTAQDLDGDWRKLDLSALQAAAPGVGWHGVRARLAAGPVALEDGRIVFSVTHEYRLPREALGLPLRETKRLKRQADGRYALCGSGSCSDGGTQSKWTVRFVENDEGLTVVNDRNDKRLGRIDGADLSEVYEGATGLQVDSFEINGDMIALIDAPWPALGLMDTDSSVFRPHAVVFAPGSSMPVFRNWDSRSELRPGDPGVPAVVRAIPPSQGRNTSVTVSEHHDRLTAVMWADLGLGSGRILGTWDSTAGVTWREGPPGLPDGAHLSYTGSAWYARDRSGKHWMHLGGAWVSIDELGFPTLPGPTLEAGLGNVTVFTSDPDGDVLDVWVLTHPGSK